MLGATGRLLRYGGRTAFTVIEIPPGLAAHERARVLDAVPPAIETTRTYPEMLTEAGFGHVVVVDLTEEYQRTIERWLDQYHRYGAQLRAVDGDDEVSERIEGWWAALDSLDRGWLRRHRYSATYSGAT